MPTDFIGLFAMLAAARVRFVLVGGLALVLHGLDRLTADVDLVIDLSADSAQAAVQALTVAGYRPLAPVDPITLADPEQRREWQTVRNMQVFSFWDSSNTRPTVDIMLSPEVPFDELWAAASVMSLGGHEVRVASIADRMKTFDPDQEPRAWGTFEDAEALRRWSFERRTPEQRLAWLKSALELAYQSGALKPRRPDRSPRRS